MSIKDDLMKYFSQFTDSSGGYGINPQAPTGGQFGQLNPQVPTIGTGGVNQLNTMQNAMSNPIDAEKAMGAMQKPVSDMSKQLIAKSIGSMGSMGGRQQPQQAPLQMIKSQQAFAQMPDATQPQQVQEFQPQQMAMMLRKRHGY